MNNYFNPSSLKREEADIMTIFMGCLKKGYDFEIDDRREYKIAKSIIELRKLIKGKLRFLKRKLQFEL